MKRITKASKQVLPPTSEFNVSDFSDDEEAVKQKSHEILMYPIASNLNPLIRIINTTTTSEEVIEEYKCSGSRSRSRRSFFL